MAISVTFNVQKGIETMRGSLEVTQLRTCTLQKKKSDFKFILTILLPLHLALSRQETNNPVLSLSPETLPHPSSPNRGQSSFHHQHHSASMSNVNSTPHKHLPVIVNQMKLRNTWPFVEIIYLVTSYMSLFFFHQLKQPQDSSLFPTNLHKFLSQHYLISLSQWPHRLMLITPILWKKARLRGKAPCLDTNPGLSLRQSSD